MSHSSSNESPVSISSSSFDISSPESGYSDLHARELSSTSKKSLFRISRQGMKTLGLFRAETKSSSTKASSSADAQPDRFLRRAPTVISSPPHSFVGRKNVESSSFELGVPPPPPREHNKHVERTNKQQQPKKRSSVQLSVQRQQVEPTSHAQHIDELFFNVHSENIQGVRDYLQRHSTKLADCQHPDSGQTILHWLAENASQQNTRMPSTEFIQELIVLGAPINSFDKTGWSPLLVATKNGNVALTYVFLQEGADPTPRLPGEISSLHLLAASASAKDSSICAAVFSKLAAVIGVNSTTSRRETPLHFAIAGNTTSVVVDILLQLGADPNIIDETGETPLMLAVRRGSSSMVAKLLSAGALVTKKTSSLAKTRKLKSQLKNHQMEKVSKYIDI